MIRKVAQVSVAKGSRPRPVIARECRGRLEVRTGQGKRGVAGGKQEKKKVKIISRGGRKRNRKGKGIGGFTNKDNTRN